MKKTFRIGQRTKSNPNIYNTINFGYQKCFKTILKENLKISEISEKFKKIFFIKNCNLLKFDTLNGDI